MMNKLIILFLLFPLVCFSQSEVDEKVRKRSERNVPSISTSENTTVIIPNSQPTIIYPYNNLYNPYNPYIPYSTRPFRNTSGYYGNDYYSGHSGYRKPSTFETRLGLVGGLSSPSSIGMYGTFGNELFLYLSYEGSKTSDYEHYDNITYIDVVGWDDEKIDEFERYTSFTVGIGGEITDDISHFAGVNLNKVDKDLVFFDEFERYTSFTVGIGGEITDDISHFAGVNLNKVDKDLVFFDEFLILSDNGEYSINDTTKRDFGLVYGALFNIKKVNFGPSIYFLTNTRLNLHFGFSF